jgi:hypothetical protein
MMKSICHLFAKSINKMGRFQKEDPKSSITRSVKKKKMRKVKLVIEIRKSERSKRKFVFGRPTTVQEFEYKPN